MWKGCSTLARIAECDAFRPVQQGMGLRHIADMGRCRHECMKQARLGIRTQVACFGEV
jgi:hypothetical protein